MLDDAVTARNEGKDGVEELGHEHRSGDVVQEIDVVIERQGLKDEEKSFRVLITTLTADDGMHYVLSFERNRKPMQKKLIPPSGEPVSLPDIGPSIWPDIKPDIKLDRVRSDSFVEIPSQISKLKTTVFDSCNVAGYITSADEKFYLTNKRFRELLGGMLGGAHGSDGSTVRAGMVLYD